MKQLALIIMLSVIAAPASAQVVPPVSTVPPVPPPAAPPPPSLAVPPVPQLDAPPQQPVTKGQGRRSFNDRVIDCLSDSTSAGLDTTERAAYSRACANR